MAVFDIPGAYLHALMPDSKTIFLKLYDQFVEIMCEINLEYKAYVRVEKVEKCYIYKYYKHCMVALSWLYSGIYCINRH